MKILENQPTEDDPFVVDNYPYGFRLKTKMRYHIETTKRGQRLVSQTLNPKTKLWNKPKKSTYTNILLGGIDEEGRFKTVGLHLYSLDEAKEFYKKYGSFFSKWQTSEYNAILGMLEVYSKVEYTVTTQRFRHKVTGEIKTSIPIFEIGEYERIDDQDRVVDEEQEARNERDKNRRLNKIAVLNASSKQGVTLDQAVETFKRS